ncbi:MAG: molybdopterin biosynthesis protein [Anaerorhabdus sp.]
MKTSYLTNKAKDTALKEYILKLSNYKLDQEIINVKDSYHRILADAVYAKRSSPHYNASAMDGIAVVASTTFHATSTTPIILTNEQYIIVDTGDKIPEGMDAVIMIEDVTYDGTNVILYAAASPWQHIRLIGEDLCFKDMIAPSYTKITPYTMGALLSGGIREVQVLKRLKVAIIPTGDEIIDSSKEPKDGEIIDFNSTIFKGLLYDYDCDVINYDIVKDNKDAIKDNISKAVNECDIVLVNAGSSAGRDDYTSLIIKELGEVVCHGIAIKPGKPTILGIVNKKAVIGIPGYPVSGVIVMREIVKKVIESYYHISLNEEDTISAKISRAYPSSLKYEEFVRVQLSKQNGSYVATPLQSGAGVITSFIKANALLKIPQNSEGIKMSETVQLTKLVSTATIDNTIAIVGSHDPLIDELADMLKKESNFQISSAHVGSMGAIMGLKRDEALIGGIHLLDVDDGSYNSNHVKKYFPNNDVIIIKGVKRAQGLIVSKGNPKNIKSIQDLSKDNISFVNRQKGSGTRILLDYLCSKNNVLSSTIYGYEHEEYTHSAVAAQVASGVCDCGLGILSAANMFDLDFIHIDYEDYDFIIKKENLNTTQIESIIKILKSETFKNRIEAIGGYKFEKIGTIEGEN